MRSCEIRIVRLDLYGSPCTISFIAKVRDNFSSLTYHKTVEVVLFITGCVFFCQKISLKYQFGDCFKRYSIMKRKIISNIPL